MKAFLIVITLLLSTLFPGASALADVHHTVYDGVSECLRCHPRAMPTHKLDRPANMTANWPLDPTGKMLCITCHDCTTGSCALRRTGKKLCAVCHDCTQGMGCLIDAAHMGNSPGIKEMVHACLECHDGSMGKTAGGPGDHKVDVLYLNKKDLNPVTEEAIVFIDGKVTCISCHNPYASDSARLAKDNTESRLCLTCHRK